MLKREACGMWLKITTITPEMSGLTNTWAHPFRLLDLRGVYYHNGFLFRATIQESSMKIKQ